MSKPNLALFFKGAQSFVTRHTPELLTGIGIAGMVTTTVLAVKATPKALQLIEEEKHSLHKDKLTVVETVKACWKPYIPATVLGVSSVACLIGSSSVSMRRNAALATAYKLSETALTEYKEKVVETIGEAKEKVVREKIDKKHLEEKPVGQNPVIVTSKGNTRCFDYHSGRRFTSDIEHIKRAVNELNRRMLLDMYVSLNDFYDELDLEHTDLGNDLGWTFDDGFVDVDFGSQLDDDGVPCIVLNYKVAPHRDYYKLS